MIRFAFLRILKEEKKQQIKEMGKFACEICEFGSSTKLYDDGKLHCTRCKKPSTCSIRKDLGEALYNAGYRQINEKQIDAIVGLAFETVEEHIKVICPELEMKHIRTGDQMFELFYRKGDMILPTNFVYTSGKERGAEND